MHNQIYSLNCVIKLGDLLFGGQILNVCDWLSGTKLNKLDDSLRNNADRCSEEEDAVK